MRTYASFILFVICFASCSMEKKPDDFRAAAKSDSLLMDSSVLYAMDTNGIYLFNCDVNRFIPKGYEMIDSATGDLNLDKYHDCILVLKNVTEDKDTTGETIKRLMIIILGMPDECIIKEKSFNIIWPLGAGGGFREAYTDVVIGKGRFMVEHQGGDHNRYTIDTYFVYNSLKNTWFLEEILSVGIDINDLEAGETRHRETVKDFGNIKFRDYKSFGE